MFAGDHPCEKCVVVDNNSIVSVEAKIYRFKEHHMWAVNGPNLYYTEPSGKYIIYDNPAILGRENDIVNNDEKDSLINALAVGIILNRTVILSPFHCGTKIRISFVHSTQDIESLHLTLNWENYIGRPPSCLIL